MKKLFDILKKTLKHQYVKMDKENLDIYQFPITKAEEQIDFALMKTGTKHPQHIHEKSSANLYIITGSGKIYINDNAKEYNAGDKFKIPKGTAHGFDVIKETLLLSIQDYPILSKDKLDFRYK